MYIFILLIGCCSVLYHIVIDCPLSHVTAFWGHPTVPSEKDYPSQFTLHSPLPEHPKLPNHWQLDTHPSHSRG